MNKHRDDDHLRVAFRTLRRETEQSGRVPQFGLMLEEAKRRAETRPTLEALAGGQRADRAAWQRRLARAGAWATAAVAASVAGLMLIDRAPTGDEDFERLVAAYATETAGLGWSSPTSGLLEVPGIDLMRSLPSIGAPIRGIDPSDLPARPSSPQEDNL